MEVILKGYAEIEGKIRPFEIHQHRWVTEMVIEEFGLPNFPIIPSIAGFQVGADMISIVWKDDHGNKGTTVFHKYRPKLAAL